MTITDQSIWPYTHPARHHDKLMCQLPAAFLIYWWTLIDSSINRHQMNEKDAAVKLYISSKWDLLINRVRTKDGRKYLEL